MTKQADDLPTHAINVMKQTLDLCADVFPNIQRSDLQRTFVDAYFGHQETSAFDKVLDKSKKVMIPIRSFYCEFCKKVYPNSKYGRSFVDRTIICEYCADKE